MVEPWLRGTLTDVDAVQRAVLHALELAREDIETWCGEMTDAELHARPLELAPVAFHLRHIARSLDRLLTYAEGGQLSSEQVGAMKSELEEQSTRAELFSELHEALGAAARRLLAFSASSLNDARGVGKKMLPTSVGGLLVHCADHTQRHVGQIVTTAKVVKGLRNAL